MTTHELRGKFQVLLAEFQVAHQRQLYDEIFLFYENHTVVSSHQPHFKKKINSNHHHVNEYISSSTGTSQQNDQTKTVGDDNNKKGTSTNPPTRTPSQQQQRDREQANSSRETDTKSCTETKERTWGQILNDMSHLLPFITAREHGDVCQMISICLLSYFLPHATPFPIFASGDDQVVGGPTSSYYMNRDAREDIVGVVPSVQSSTENNKTNNNNTINTKNNIHNKKHGGILPLEEILEYSLRMHDLTSVQYDPSSVLQDEKFLASFWHFLQKGLCPFLSSRPLSPVPYSSTTSWSGVTDLIHVLSMAVAPEIKPCLGLLNENNESLTAANGDGDGSSFGDNNSEFQKRANRLMTCLYPLYFQISYAYRAEIVHILARSLILPELNFHQTDDFEEDALFRGQKEFLEGGLRHLRAALNTFSLTALSSHHVIDAHQVLVNIAVDTGEESFAHDEMKTLVTSLVQDRTKVSKSNSVPDAKCRQISKLTPRQRERRSHIRRYARDTKRSNIEFSTFLQHVTRFNEVNESLCIHCARSDLLQDLILRYNGARHYADGEFTQSALTELTNAVQSSLESLRKYEEEEEASKDEKRNIPLPLEPCQIAGLLDCARTLFYFLLDVKVDGQANEKEKTTSSNQIDDDRMVEGETKDANDKVEKSTLHKLVDFATVMLTSPERCIRISSSSLLSLAFAYGNKEETQTYLPNVYSALQISLNEPQCNHGLFQDLILVASRLSKPFAISIISLLIKSMNDLNINIGRKGEQRIESAMYLVSSVALAHPQAVTIEFEALRQIVDVHVSNKGIQKHAIAAFLSLRLAYHYNNEKTSPQHQVEASRLLVKVNDPWDLFQLGRHALCTSNFDLAQNVFDRLQGMTSTTSSYLWLSSLSKIAKAETFIAKEGALGITTALPILDSVIISLRAFPTLASTTINDNGDSASFQKEFLCQRRDFISLCLVVRGLCAEMRLTNSPAKRTVRPNMHQRNSSHCFFMIASRYASLYRRYGMIHCQQTRTTLRNNFALCHFIGNSIQKVFTEAFRGTNKKEQIHHLDDGVAWPRGDNQNPLCEGINKLNKKIIEPMNESVEPSVRAEALIQIIDFILKNPSPFPRGFTVQRKMPIAQIKLSANPESIEEVVDNSHSEEDVEDFDNEAEVIEVKSGSPFKLYASGIIPKTYFERSDLVFSQIMIFHSISYDGPLPADDDGEDENAMWDTLDKKDRLENKSADVAVDEKICSGGKFISTIDCVPIRQEGYYRMDVKLRVRDVRNGQYEIPIEDDAGLIFICII